jgi:hypothetical protein
MSLPASGRKARRLAIREGGRGSPTSATWNLRRAFAPPGRPLRTRLRLVVGRAQPPAQAPATSRDDCFDCQATSHLAIALATFRSPRTKLPRRAVEVSAPERANRLCIGSWGIVQAEVLALQSARREPGGAAATSPPSTRLEAATPALGRASLAAQSRAQSPSGKRLDSWRKQVLGTSARDAVDPVTQLLLSR